MERRWGGGERGGWRGDGDVEPCLLDRGYKGWNGDGREGGEGRPRGNRFRMVPQGASSVGGSQVRDVRQTAPWVTSRQGHWDVIRRIMARGRQVSPILLVPWVDVRIFRIDWLHTVDLGVGADWSGSFFVLVASKMPGPSHKARVSQLWGRVPEDYERRGIQDRLQNLTPSMLQAQREWPKPRCSAAQCRALVDFGMEILFLLDAGSPEEEAAIVGMRHLYTCYQCLSEEVIFFKGAADGFLIQVRAAVCRP